jgi:hypothetical protein
MDFDLSKADDEEAARILNEASSLSGEIIDNRRKRFYPLYNYLRINPIKIIQTY